MEETPAVQDAEIVTPRQATTEEAAAVEAQKANEGAAVKAKEGPAYELRQAQALLAGGMFPGQMAPAVQSAFVYLGKLAAKIELDAEHEAEFKARQKA